MSEVIAAPTLRPIITNKGLEAAIQASTLGKTCEITHVGIGNLAGTGSEEDLVLQGEQFRVPVADGKTVNQFQVNVAALITDTHPTIAIHGIGFYLADGTLFAVYQTESVLIYHTAGSSLLVGMDVLMSNIPAGSIVVESTGANLVLGDFVPQERTVNGKELRKDIVLTAEDVGAMPLGSGGGDRIGSVVQMHGTMGSLVYEDDKVYLKEGAILEDAANVFPEAFAKLNGANGKQFIINTAGRLNTSGTVLGFVKSGDKALVVIDTSSTTSINLIDPKTRKLSHVTTHNNRAKSNFVEYGGKLIGAIDGNKFLVIDLSNPADMKEVSSPTGNWGTAYMTHGRATKGGILWATGNRGEMAFMKVSDAGEIQDLKAYTITAASAPIRLFLSFTDKTGNDVNFVVTSNEIYWKAGTEHTSAAGWEKKWPSNDQPAIGATYATYSVEADAVYFGDSYGAYMVCDPRMSPLNEAGDVGIYSAFFGEFENGLSWSQIGDTIFVTATPASPTDSPNVYYKLDPATAEWESYKHGVNVRLGSSPASVGGVEIGEHMVAYGLLGTAGSGQFVAMFSSPLVHLQADPTTKGGVSNYVRIK
ncbi:MAG: phage tail protein [Aeromonadaceae bacterium]